MLTQARPRELVTMATPRSTKRHDNAFFADMHSFIVGMVRHFRIDIAITVGHPAMIGNGPLGGHTVETGLVIASTEPLAADVVGLTT
jgi:uncharacterized protein (DUF362 family)